MEAERWPEAAAAMTDALAQLPADDEQVRPAAHANLRMIEHHRGLLALERGELDAAMEHLERAIDQLAAAGDAAAEARLLHDLAVVRIELEDLERARVYLAQALPAAEASGDRDLLRAVHFQTGLALLEIDPGSAMVALHNALAVDPAAADELSAACRYNLGILLYRDGAHAESRRALEESRELYRALGRSEQVALIDEYLEEFEALEER
jgi:tetratricopeptide (TPR) repeat protein